MTLVGIVPAGGSGERLGALGPKAFVVLAGRPMLAWSIDVLARVCDRVVVAVPAGHDAEVEGADTVVGGAARSESVRNAVGASPEASAYLVHDAARPLLTEELARACAAALAEGVEGAVAAARVTDTIKRDDGAGHVAETLDRSALWAIQTPQAFEAGSLRRALDVDATTLAAATDDASLVEAAGGRIALVESPAENFKVTTQPDLRRAEAVLSARC